MTGNKISKIIKIKYTNWRGESSIRSILPIELWYGNTKWHNEDQWFLKAIDIDKDEERDFAVVDIKKWSKV
jgi:predicted DNA-binding transcriptional regulator YafY